MTASTTSRREGYIDAHLGDHPAGWYVVGWSSKLKPGEVKAIEIVGHRFASDYTIVLEGLTPQT